MWYIIEEILVTLIEIGNISSTYNIECTLFSLALSHYNSIYFFLYYKIDDNNIDDLP